MIIYDTNLLIKALSKNQNVNQEGITILDFNLLEWLRGKEKEQSIFIIFFQFIMRFMTVRTKTFFFLQGNCNKISIFSCDRKNIIDFFAFILKKLAKLDILIIGSLLSSFVAITMIRDYFLFKIFAFFLPQRDRKLIKKRRASIKRSKSFFLYKFGGSIFEYRHWVNFRLTFALGICFCRFGDINYQFHQFIDYFVSLLFFV